MGGACHAYQQSSSSSVHFNSESLVTSVTCNLSFLDSDSMIYEIKDWEKLAGLCSTLLNLQVLNINFWALGHCKPTEVQSKISKITGHLQPHMDQQRFSLAFTVGGKSI